MERERDSLEPSVFVHMLTPYRPASVHTEKKRKRKKEEKESVGGSVANHFLPGRVRSSNNRILVRAASEKGCTPLYVRSERTVMKKKGGGEGKKEARGKEGEEKKKKKKRTKVLLDPRITLLCTLFI